MSEDLRLDPVTIPKVLPQPFARVLWDRQDCIPLRRSEGANESILLLTPAIVPPSIQQHSLVDPFEPLGQSLAKCFRSVRHVPYTKHQGLTGVHVAFLRRANIVVFVLTGPPNDGAVSQVELASVAGRLCESIPMVVVACFEVDDEALHIFEFRTVLRTSGFLDADLRALSSLLLGGEVTQKPSTATTIEHQFISPSWAVQPWSSEQDLRELHALWLGNMPRRLHLDATSFESLLQRDGFAMHHVVRDATSGSMVGFCATYTTFADSKGQELIGSIAALIVHSDFRQRGIGQLLHNEALAKLGKVRGVRRVQLGSTFPRLLYGVPKDLPHSQWFEHRGWTLDQALPGKGRIMTDWLLWFNESPPLNLASAGLSFRSCEISDAWQVAEMVSRHSDRKFGFGWYDQYARLLDTSHLGDIVLGFEGTTLAAAAITYVPSSGNPTASDIPWPGSIGLDVGGVTCVCIKDDDPQIVNRRDTIMVRLLHACCKSLSDREMVAVFLDGMSTRENGVETLGFRKWAEYKEVWREA